jgi:hypothetical protein
MQQLTDLYGDMFYSEAWRVMIIPLAYDDDCEIYQSFIYWICDARDLIR